MTDLENILELESRHSNKYKELKVKPIDVDSIKNFLEMLKTKDDESYLNCIRVGILTPEIARSSFLSPIYQRGVFFAATLHDIGKYFTPDEVLKKKKNFTTEDMAIMKEHVKHSYMMLRNRHPFSAEVVLRHHKYQKNSYPLELPPPEKFSPQLLLMIESSARLLAIADSYDAMTYRQNDRFGGRTLSKDEVKETLKSDYPDMTNLIDNMYRGGIFGGNI